MKLYCYFFSGINGMNSCFVSEVQQVVSVGVEMGSVPLEQAQGLAPVVNVSCTRITLKL